ncbi:MAG: hypothetical protein JXI43_05805 [Tissierellales bacterium]|nr:hypothetical protein [Tissierellales bacterium]
MDSHDMPHISENRTKLLEELALFLFNTVTISGITRIALIGSLCTNKSNPKDIDVLINIEDSADLSPLAKQIRGLNGRVQTFNHNAEVFLANTQGKYLGRICHWKDCRPGIRLSCDALNCGARKYLHDDLKTITLTKELVLYPPLELWPNIIARTSIPVDVEKIIIDPLREYMNKDKN